MRPYRRPPTRLLCPWDSPVKNTGVGCHFLLQCMKVKSQSQVAQSCLTLSDLMDCSLPGSSVHGIFQARVLVWGAIAFSSERLRKCHFCCGDGLLHLFLFLVISEVCTLSGDITLLTPSSNAIYKIATTKSSYKSLCS